MRIKLLFYIFFILSNALQAQQTCFWEGKVSAFWNDANNWRNQQRPSELDTVIISNYTGDLVLENSITISGLQHRAARLQLNGHELKVRNATLLYSGSVVSGSLICEGNSLLVGQQGPVLLNARLQATCSILNFKQSTFKQPVTLIKTGPSNDVSAGDNHFEQKLSITNVGSGNLIFANQFDDRFDADVELNSYSIGLIQLAYTKNSVFGGNLICNSNLGKGIRLGQNGGLSYINNGTIQSLVFNAGELSLSGVNSHSLNLLFTDSAGIVLQKNCKFTGDVFIESPGLRFDNTTFLGSAEFVKTGKLDELSVGGNRFESSVKLNLSGSGYLIMALQLPDYFGGTLNLNSSGSGVLYLAHGSLGNVFAKKITLSSSGAGIRFGQNGGTSFFQDNIVSETLSSGSISIKNVEQAANKLFKLQGSDSVSCNLQSNNSWRSKVELIMPSLRADSNTFYAEAYFEKTGNLGDTWNGANMFFGTCTLVNSGLGNMTLANLNPDSYGNLTCDSRKGTILLAHSSLGNSVTGVLAFKSSGQGIRVGQNKGALSLAENAEIRISEGDFTYGSLLLKHTEVNCTNPSILKLSDSASVYLQNECKWNSTLLLEAPSIRIDSNWFNQGVSIIKTGFSNDVSLGGNRFNAEVTLSHKGTGNWTFAQKYPDIFYKALNIRLEKSGSLQMANGSDGNAFYAPVTVSIQEGGLRFGQSAGTLTFHPKALLNLLDVEMADLFLKNCTFLGEQPINWLLRNNSQIYLQSGTTFNQEIQIEADAIRLDGAQFMRNAHFIKTGSNNDGGLGGCLFAGETTRFTILKGAGFFSLSANQLSDVFLGNVVFTNSGGGIRFGQQGARTTLPKKVEIGESGFQNANLFLRYVTLLADTINWHLDSTAQLLVQDSCSFSGDLSISAGGFTLSNSLFKGKVYLTKTGQGNDINPGGNQFLKAIDLHNTTRFIQFMAFGKGDKYAGQINLHNQGEGNISLAYRDTSWVNKHVYSDGNKAPTFGIAQGVLALIGDSTQLLRQETPFPINIKNLYVNKPSGQFNFNDSLTIDGECFFERGHIYGANYSLAFSQNGKAINASKRSHVIGAVSKVGLSDFIFPLGDSVDYFPIGISDGTNTSERLKIRYVPEFYTIPETLKDLLGLASINNQAYWEVEKTSVNQAVNYLLFWDSTKVYVPPRIDDLTAVAISDNSFVNLFAANKTGNRSAGQLKSLSDFSKNGKLFLAQNYVERLFEIALDSFSIKQVDSVHVQLSWLHVNTNLDSAYIVQKLDSAGVYKALYTIPAGKGLTAYRYTDTKTTKGLNTYRLKKLNTDDDYSFSAALAINLGENEEFMLYPNPFNEYLTLLGEGLANGNIELKVYAMNGNLVYKSTLVNEGIYLKKPIDLSWLTPGVYSMHIQTLGTSKQLRFSKY